MGVKHIVEKAGTDYIIEKAGTGICHAEPVDPPMQDGRHDIDGNHSVG